jgi:hypothetical protein
MSYNPTPPIPASLDTATLEATGLSETQEKACWAAMQAFLKRKRLAAWGLNMNLTNHGPETWQLDIAVVASAEFGFKIRSSQITVDKTVDLGRVVDLYLETHYNACMNSKAMSASSPRANR